MDFFSLKSYNYSLFCILHLLILSSPTIGNMKIPLSVRLVNIAPRLRLSSIYTCWAAWYYDSVGLLTVHFPDDFFFTGLKGLNRFARMREIK